MVTLKEKVRGSPKSIGCIFWGPRLPAQNPVDPVIDEVFQSGPKQWTDHSFWVFSSKVLEIGDSTEGL